MSERNTAIARRFLDAFNDRNVSVLKEIVADNFVDHQLPSQLLRGPEGVQTWWHVLTSAFPDCRITIEDLIACEDKIVARFTFTGTHQGEFRGIPATGRKFSVASINIGRFKDGKLVESWGNSDALGAMQQIGVIPS